MTMAAAGYLICWGDVAQLETGRERFEHNAFVNSQIEIRVRA